MGTPTGQFGTARKRRLQSLAKITVAAAGLLALRAAQAQDWPQWRGPNRDGKTSGFSVPETWPKQLTRKWRVAVGLGDATPALVGDRLYVFTRQESEEVTRCLDAETGKEIWQNKYAVPDVLGPDIGHSGPRSSPAVASGKVVTLGLCGVVSCLATDTGKAIWRKDDFPGVWPRFHTAMSPLIEGDLVITQLGNESQGTVVAYELATGNAKWTLADEGSGYASPVLLTVGSTKMIVTQTSSSVVGIGLRDGKLLWRLPFATQAMVYNVATPIVEGQTVIYSGQGRGTIATRIEQKGDKFEPRELWRNSTNSVAFNSPVLKHGLIFGLSQRGKFFCLKSLAGQTAWMEATGGRGDFGAIVDLGPVLVGLTAASQLTVFKPSAESYTELAHFKVSEKQTFAHPVASGKRLFVKDQDSLTLWSVE